MVQTNAVRHLQDLPQPNATVVSQDHVAVIYRHPRNNHNNNQNEPRGNQVIKKPTKVLGFIQVGVGVINLLAALVFISVGAYDKFAYYGDGGFGVPAVYTGAVSITNGIIGYFSSQNVKSVFLNRCNMIFSVVSCISAIVSICAYGIFLGELSSCPTLLDPHYIDGSVCQKKTFATGIVVVLLVFNSLELFIALASSIFTCIFYAYCFQCCQGDEEEIINENNDQGNAIRNECQREVLINHNYRNYGSNNASHENVLSQQNNQNHEEQLPDVNNRKKRSYSY